MTEIEKFVLQHASIDVLCSYVENHYHDCSREMRENLNSYLGRLNRAIQENTLGGNTNKENFKEEPPLYDWSIKNFLVKYAQDTDKNNINRIISTLQQCDFVTLRQVLGLRRSDLLKIRGFGKQSLRCFEDALENSGIDPKVIIY